MALDIISNPKDIISHLEPQLRTFKYLYHAETDKLYELDPTSWELCEPRCKEWHEFCEGCTVIGTSATGYRKRLCGVYERLYITLPGGP